MPRQHIDALLWRVYQEVEELLHDLEHAEANCSDRLDLAGKFLAIVTNHIEPLRRVVEDVECHQKAEALAEDLALSRIGPL